MSTNYDISPENRRIIFEQALAEYKLIPAWKSFSEEQLVILAEQIADNPCPNTYGEGEYTNPLDNSDGALDNDTVLYFNKALESFIDESDSYILKESYNE